MDRVASDEVKRAILDTSARCATPSVLSFNRRESIRARVRRGGVRALLISNPPTDHLEGIYTKLTISRKLFMKVPSLVRPFVRMDEATD